MNEPENKIEEINLGGVKKTETKQRKALLRQKHAELIKALIKEALYNSVAQAIIKAFQTPHVVLKLFLFACILFSGTITSYLIAQSILTYLSYGVSTTSRTLYETSAVFPKITVCNRNQFTTPFAFEFLRNLSIIEFNGVDMFDSNQMQNLTFQDKVDMFDELNAVASMIVNSKKFSDYDRKKLGHSLQDMISYCTYNRNLCSYADFEWKFQGDYGNCYMFNSGTKSLKSVLTGVASGFELGMSFCLINSIYLLYTVKNSLQ